MKQLTPLKVGDETQKILVEMSLNEFVNFVEFISGDNSAEETMLKTSTNTPPIMKDIRKGLKGIMEVFACGKSEAFEYSHAPWFQSSVIIRNGRHMAFDADIAIANAPKDTNTNNK